MESVGYRMVVVVGEGSSLPGISHDARGTRAARRGGAVSGVAGSTVGGEAEEEEEEEGEDRAAVLGDAAGEDVTFPCVSGMDALSFFTLLVRWGEGSGVGRGLLFFSCVGSDEESDDMVESRAVAEGFNPLGEGGGREEGRGVALACATASTASPLLFGWRRVFGDVERKGGGEREAAVVGSSMAAGTYSPTGREGETSAGGVAWRDS